MSDVKVIVATDLEGGFGKNGVIPWHYPEDFAFFKKVTAGQPCVMGRVTYDEINTLSASRGVPPDILLPGRECFVLSNTLTQLPNATVINSLADMPLSAYFVIGGRALYNTVLDYASDVFLTTVHGNYGCDTFFNLRYMRENFKVVDTYPSNNPDLTFERYQRK